MLREVGVIPEHRVKHVHVQFLHDQADVLVLGYWLQEWINFPRISCHSQLVDSRDRQLGEPQGEPDRRGLAGLQDRQAQSGL